MVFLGGAVLANIVSHCTSGKSATLFLMENADGRQRKHVDIETGVARARTKNIRKAWLEVVQWLGAFFPTILYTTFNIRLSKSGQLPPLWFSVLQVLLQIPSFHTQHPHLQHHGSHKNADHKPEHHPINDRLSPCPNRSFGLQPRKPSPTRSPVTATLPPKNPKGPTMHPRLFS